MKKGLYLLLLSVMIFLFILPNTVHAEETLGTISEENPSLVKIFAIKKGEEYTFELKIEDNPINCWLYVSKLNMRSLENSTLTAVFSDEKGEELTNFTLGPGKGGAGYPIYNIKDNKTYNISIKDADYSGIDEMAVCINVYVETFGGKVFDVNPYIIFLQDNEKASIYEFDDKELIENYCGNYTENNTPVSFGYTFRNDSKGVIITGILNDNPFFSDEDDILKIPEMIDGKTVIGIDDKAFTGVYMKSLYLPSTIKTIGKDIIDLNMSILDVYYDGTISEYNKIIIAENTVLDKALVHHMKEEWTTNDYSFYNDGYTVTYDVNDHMEVYNEHIVSIEKLKQEYVQNNDSDIVKNHPFLNPKNSREYFYDNFIFTKDGKLYAEKLDANGYEKKLIMKNVLVPVEEFRGPKKSRARDFLYYVVTKKGILYRLEISMDPEIKVKKTKIMKNVKDLIASPQEDSTERARHYFIIKKDNSLWGFGNNKNCELGQGNNKKYKKPVKILTDVSLFWYDYNRYRDQSSGGGVCFAIRSDGSLWGWGYNEFYKLSYSEERFIQKPKKLIDEVKYVYFDSHAIIVYRMDDSLWCWGSEYNSLDESERVPIVNYGALPLTKIGDNVKTATKDVLGIYYITNDNSLYYYKLQTGQEHISKKLLIDVITVKISDLKTLVLMSDGTQYDIMEYAVHGGKIKKIEYED